MRKKGMWLYIYISTIKGVSSFAFGDVRLLEWDPTTAADDS